MKGWHYVVNTLVVAFASFFTYVGISFLLMPITGSGPLIEGGATSEKAVLGVVFILAAAPMFYYVFAPSAKALPPKPKPAPKPPEPEERPPEGA